MFEQPINKNLQQLILPVQSRCILQQFQLKQQTKMSASLPRIKTIHEITKLNSMQSHKELKMKFRKLALEGNGAENGQQRKKSIKSIKTQRLKSLERYTTIEEQRQFKNEKIHLNLIQRKLLSGTYDQKNETGHELNALKQKRDQIKVQMVLKQRQGERMKALLEEVKMEIAAYLAKKGQHDGRLKEIRDKHEVQQEKAENTQQSKLVFQNMIKIRQEINMVLTKRSNSLKGELNHLISAQALLDNQLRQLTQKCVMRQSKLESLLKQSVKQRQQRNQHISKHQQKISKRKQGQISHVQKSKKYIEHLDELEHSQQLKQFHSVYDKILANLFISRYCKIRSLDLVQKYKIYQQLYGTMASYKSFEVSNPEGLVKRFFEHVPEKQKQEQEIKMNQGLLQSSQVKNHQLKKQLATIQNQIQQHQQKFIQTHNSDVMSKERQTIKDYKSEVEQIEEKIIRIKSQILSMLNELNQRGDKKIYKGIQSTVNNLTLLTNVLKQAFNSLS